MEFVFKTLPTDKWKYGLAGLKVVLFTIRLVIIYKSLVQVMFKLGVNKY